jgi:cytochrome P450
MLTELARYHPRLAYLRILNRSAYLLIDPELVREVLVRKARSVHKGTGIRRAVPFLGVGLISNEGETHRLHRRAVQPAFHKEQITAYGHHMTAAADALAWRDGDRVDLAGEMGRLTFTIASEALLGTDLPADEARAARAAVVEFGAMYQRLSYAPSSLLVRLPSPLRHRLRRTRRRLDEVLSRVLARRRRQSGVDFLSLLLDSGLSDQEIFDEARTFIAAGHESTANALTWTLWLLDRHPSAASRLRAELDALPTRAAVEDYPRLHYTRAVVAESMRLYPPVHVIGRRAYEPIELDGWPVPAGDRLITSPWVTHRDPRWWGDDAALFRPERWLDRAGGYGEGNPGQPRLAYFPFGAGPRICIGDGFALLEAALVLATVASRWHPVVERDPRPQPGFTLRTDGPVMAVLHTRTVR